MSIRRVTKKPNTQVVDFAFKLHEGLGSKVQKKSRVTLLYWGRADADANKWNLML